MWEVNLSEIKIFINMKDILISHFSCYRVKCEVMFNYWLNENFTI